MKRGLPSHLWEVTVKPLAASTRHYLPPQEAAAKQMNGNFYIFELAQPSLNARRRLEPPAPEA